MITIAETSSYTRMAEKLFSEEERNGVVDFLAENPKAGDLMEGTGGIRKLRWRRNHKGSRGGVRVIYYFHNETMPLYLLTLFGKGEKENLTKAERNALASLVKLLVDAHEEGADHV
jgi:hypothetical protein